MSGEYPRPLSLTQRRASMAATDDEENTLKAAPSPLSSSPRLPRRSDSIHTRPHALPTPSRSIPTSIPHNLLPSAPASPPTPAPSPTPHHRAPSWNNANENEDAFLKDARSHFSRLDSSERQRYLAEILNLCDSQQLIFVHDFVSPRLKKDPFRTLPNELCLRVYSCPSTVFGHLLLTSGGLDSHLHRRPKDASKVFPSIKTMARTTQR
jgi:hypothetical protein